MQRHYHHHGGCLPLLGLGLWLALVCVTRPALAMNVKCVDVPHNKINVNDMFGTWYPMEIVLHRNDSKIYGVPVDSPCAEVTVEALQPNKRTYRLIWNTTEGELEFRLSQKGARDSAQFTVVGDQIGGKSISFTWTVMALEGDRAMVARLCSPTVHNVLLLARAKAGGQGGGLLAAQLTQFPYPQHERRALCSAAPAPAVEAALSLGVLLLLRYIL